MWNYKRKTAVNSLMEQFEITRRYAETLYASHRELDKAAGAFTPVYKVLDTRNGKPVKPYMSKRLVRKPRKGDLLRTTSAREEYINCLKAKIEIAEQL
jgi:hypothetical protein